MKTPKTNLYSRLALATSVTLVVGYFVVYAAYQTFQAEEYQSGAPLSSTFLGKIVSNLDEINGKILNFGFSGGNVGIGTVSPTAKLHIQDSTAARVIIDSSDSNNYSMITFKENGALGGFVEYINSNFVTANRRNYLELGALNAIGGIAFWAGNAEKMRIDNNGNVGIGTASPVRKLQVSGGSTGVYEMQVGAGTVGQKASLDVVTNHDSIGFQVWDDNNLVTPKFIVQRGGNVGIGIITPAIKLDVAGDVRSWNAAGLTNGGSYLGLYTAAGGLPGYPSSNYPTLKTDSNYIYFSINGSYSAYMSAGGVLTAISDKNKKENFRDLNFQEILNKIDKLPITEWNFKAEDKSIRHIGPFAQDFHALFGLNGPNDKMMSNLDPTGVALAGIKGLSERSKAQEEEIQILKRENNELKTQNKLIEERLKNLENK